MQHILNHSGGKPAGEIKMAAIEKELDGLKKDYVKNAVSLLEKGKITASCAAEIAGMNYYEFEEYLRKQKIRWKS